jgi:hypothetical protein
MQARKYIAGLNGILWSKDIRNERKLNICNALIKSSLLYGAETWRLYLTDAVKVNYILLRKGQYLRCKRRELG